MCRPVPAFLTITAFRIRRVHTEGEADVPIPVTHSPISANHAIGIMKSSTPNLVCVRYRAQYLRPTKTVQKMIIKDAVATTVGPISSARNSGEFSATGAGAYILELGAKTG